MDVPSRETAGRFWSKVAKSETCWNWTAGQNGSGYGVFWPATKQKVYAHRWAYEFFNGKIPDGMFIDHICFNTRCVNPSHLRVVTHKQNMEHIQRARRHSISGVRGVATNTRKNIVYARVRHNNKNYAGKHYPNTAEGIAKAAQEAVELRAKYFTHQ